MQKFTTPPSRPGSKATTSSQTHPAKVQFGRAIPAPSRSTVQENLASPSDYEIIKGFDLGSRSKYPFSKLQLGDAFHHPCAPDDRPEVSAQIHNAARRFRERHNSSFRISLRSTTHNGQPGIMVCRIK